MLIYERDDLLGLVVGKTQAATDFFGHSHAHLNVPIEANAVRRDPKGGRFPYIVQERSPGQSRRTGMRQFLKQKERVDEHVSFRMKLWRLLDALHGGDFRQQRFDIREGAMFAGVAPGRTWKQLVPGRIAGALAFYLANQKEIDAYLIEGQRAAEVQHRQSRQTNAELIAKLQRARNASQIPG